MTHDTFVRIVSLSLDATEPAISISEVQIIFITTWHVSSSTAFAWGVLMVVGLGFTPYSLHRCMKSNLNSLLLSNIILGQRGLMIMIEDLSKYASLD